MKKLVGRHIFALRDQRGWSQAELAERAGVEPPTITRWEAGARMPEPDRIEALAKAFGVPQNFFFQDTGTFGLPEPTAEKALEVLEKLVSDSHINHPLSHLGSELINRLAALDKTEIDQLIRLVKRDPNIARQVDSLVSKDKEQKRYKRETK